MIPFSKIYFTTLILIFISCNHTITLPKPSTQNITIGNFGNQTIYNPNIRYGELIVPRGSNLKTMHPAKYPIYTEIWELTIPESATVTWQSFDQVQHSQVFYIKKAALKIEGFSGCTFKFYDDTVKVFIQTKVRHPKGNATILNEIQISE